MIHFRRFLNLKSVSKDYGIYVLGQILGVASGLLLIPVFTQKLPIAEFGIIGLLWLANPLLTRLISLGADVAVSLKYFKVSHRELTCYLYNALLLITITCVLVGLVGVWQIRWVQVLIDSTVSDSTFCLLIVSIIGTIYHSMMRDFLMKMRRATENVFLSILPPLTVAAATFILVTWVEASYVSYVAGMALGNGFFGLIAVLFFTTNFPLRFFKYSAKMQRELLTVGLPTLPGTLSWLILASGDRYIIKWFWGLEAVAIYTLGYRLAEYLNTGLLTPLQKTLNPIILEKSAMNFDDASAYNYRIMLVSFGGLSLAMAAAAIPMRDVVDLLGGSVYGTSYVVFLVALPGVLLFALAQISSYLLLHLENTVLFMWQNIIGAGVNIALNLWLIPLYGIVSAAFTTTFAFLVMYVFIFIFLKRFTEADWNLLLTLTRLLPFVLFLMGLFAVDNVLYFDWWQAYAIKFGLWVGLVLVTWVVFTEFRDFGQSLLSRYRYIVVD